ncbi:MAG: DegQ family serine endoprotease [Gammaproteobacteria bacterium]
MQRRFPLMQLWLLLPLLLGLAATPAAAHLPPALNGNPLPSLAPMLEHVTPAVVNIASIGKVRVQQNPLFQDPFFRQFFNIPDQPQERRTQSLGSGVIVDAKHGYILTNNHVIKNADRINVTLRDGRQFKAKLIGTDPASDVAVIQIPAQQLTALPLADSSKLQVGDFVVAIGNPFGLGQTVTSGIVSALGRTGLGIEGYEDFIQTDASINPGNSGGALVNLAGQLEGINTAIIAPSGGNVGIGFAIPVNMARDIMDQLIKYGHVRRGQLGVTAQNLTPDLAQALGITGNKGAVVAQVDHGSPAAKAGLKAGDVIVTVDGKPVRDAADVRNRVGLLMVGQTVQLGIRRNGKPLTIEAVIAQPQMTRMDAKRLNPKLEGAELSNIVEGMPQYGQVQGVLVAGVAPDSPAWNTGLRGGDIILSVNRHPVHSLNQVSRAATDSGGRLLLNIKRGNGALFLLIR